MINGAFLGISRRTFSQPIFHEKYPYCRQGTSGYYMASNLTTMFETINSEVHVQMRNEDSGRDRPRKNRIWHGLAQILRCVFFQTSNNEGHVSAATNIDF
jgi:hypothetical protein